MNESIVHRFIVSPQRSECSLTKYVLGFFGTSPARNLHSRPSANFASTFSRPNHSAPNRAAGEPLFEPWPRRFCLMPITASIGSSRKNRYRHSMSLSMSRLGPFDSSGQTLTISERFESLFAMDAVIKGVFFVLPTLLNVLFADPPYIERVDGKVGLNSFRWELDEWHAEFRTTTQQQQEERFAKAWERIGMVCDPNRSRLTPGLHYFHVACRLTRPGLHGG